MKYFIVSDIHSYYKILINALADAGFDKFNPNHTLITLGDNFDRGRESKGLLTFLLSLDPKRTFLIKGNHEFLLEKVLKRKNLQWWDISNGTATTLLDLLDLGSSLDLGAEHFEKATAMLKPLFERMVDYIELKKHILVHSSLPVGEDSKLDPYWRDTD